MNNYSVSVDIDDLKNKKKMLDDKYNELVKMFQNYKEMIDGTKEIYDTESANYFRKVADEYMNIAITKLETDFKTYIDKLNNTINSYTEYNNLIASKVSKEQVK